jgi:uncharacterized membrane protein YkvA (DUF1232 family)
MEDRPSLVARLKDRANALKVETYALYLAARDPRTPWYAKTLVGLVVAHTFSPIDLIPDFIPVLGYLDDLIIIPAGIWLALKMIPPEVIAESRKKANAALQSEKPTSWVAAVVIVCIWLILTTLFVILLIRMVKK